MPQGSRSDPQLLHPYSFAVNNPLRFNDPTGNSPQEVIQEVKESIESGVEFGRAAGEAVYEARQLGGVTPDTAREVGLKGFKVLGLETFGEFVDVSTEAVGEGLYGNGTSLDSFQKVGHKGLEAIPLSKELHLTEVGNLVDRASKALPKAYYDARLARFEAENRKVLEARIAYDKAPKFVEGNGRSPTLSVGGPPPGADKFYSRTETPSSVTTCYGWKQGQDESIECDTRYK